MESGEWGMENWMGKGAFAIRPYGWGIKNGLMMLQLFVPKNNPIGNGRMQYAPTGNGKRETENGRMQYAPTGNGKMN